MSSTRHGLQRTFREGFTAEDVAEALVSYDFDQPAAAIQALMQARNFDVAGVRFAGVVAGWVERSALGGGACQDHAHDIEAEVVIDARAPLAEVLDRLDERPFLLVTAFDAVGGIVTRADLQKAPVRMWLFGIITLIETTLSRWLEPVFGADGWREHLSPSRLARAEELHAERRRRNESLDLEDCLSFADKLWILSKSPRFLEVAGYPSRRVARERMKDLEQLRNRLAHAQELSAEQLVVAGRLARHLERLLEVVSTEPGW